MASDEEDEGTEGQASCFSRAARWIRRALSRIHIGSRSDSSRIHNDSRFDSSGIHYESIPSRIHIGSRSDFSRIHNDSRSDSFRRHNESIPSRIHIGSRSDFSRIHIGSRSDFSRIHFGSRSDFSRRYTTGQSASIRSRITDRSMSSNVDDVIRIEYRYSGGSRGREPFPVKTRGSIRPVCGSDDSSPIFARSRAPTVRSPPCPLSRSAALQDSTVCTAGSAASDAAEESESEAGGEDDEVLKENTEEEEEEEEEMYDDIPGYLVAVPNLKMRGTTAGSRASDAAEQPEGEEGGEDHEVLKENTEEEEDVYGNDTSEDEEEEEEEEEEEIYDDIYECFLPALLPMMRGTTAGSGASDAAEQPEGEEVLKTGAESTEERGREGRVLSVVPRKRCRFSLPIVAASSRWRSLSTGSWKDEPSPTSSSGHSLKRKAAPSASAARTKRTAVRLQSPSPSGPAGSLLSEQPDCEAAGDVVPMEVEPAVPAVSCPPAPPSSPPGPGRAGRGSGRLPRSRSLPSLAHIPCAESRSFTRANSSPDVLLASSWEEFTPAVSAEAFRFQCSRPGLYQCRETGLLFHMEAGGDVVYRTVPWSRRLLARHHKQPAGPLFDITCEQRCVRQLHLPHCEIRSTGGWRFLSVAHEHDDGVEFIAPHKVTATHVVINVSGFSAFGNVKDDDCPPAPVRALVLLFYRPPADPDPEALLNVLLLPRNVVLRDVVRTRRKLVGEEVYIETSPHCKLQPKQEYTLSAGPGDDSVLVQPAEAEFDSDNYDNYFPSFQVSWETVLKHVRLLLRDSGGSRSVWERRVGLPAAGGRRSSGPSALNGPPDERLMEVRSGFIQGVSGPVLKSLLDKLFEKTVLAEPERESADERPNLRDKARFVIDTVRKKGAAASSQMIEFLCDVDPFLCEHLGLL